MAWRSQSFAAACIVLLSAIPLFGQGTTFPVVNRNGQPVGGASVAICTGTNPGTSPLPCASLATTFTDETLSVQCTKNATSLNQLHGTGCTNPGFTNPQGNAITFTNTGAYWAQVYGYQITPSSFPFTVGGTGGGGSDIPNYAKVFASQTTVVIPQSLSTITTPNVLLQCFDTSNPPKQFEPDHWTINGTTLDVTVYFATAASGYCVVNSSGGPGGTGNIIGNSLTLNRAVFGLGGNAIKVDNAISTDGFGNLSASSMTGLVLQVQNSAPVDEKLWSFNTDATAGTLVGRAFNDAYTAANPWIYVFRTGYTPTEILFFPPLTSNVNGVINPKAPPYNATGDGSTDDTAAIQAAINAATAGQEVLLPSGTYKTTSSLTFCSVNGVTLSGQTSPVGSAGGSVIQLSGALSSPVINTCTSTNWVISHLLLKHIGGTPTAGGDGISACQTQYCNRPIIEDVTVNTNWNGYNLGPTTSGRISNSTADQNYSNGVYLHGANFAYGNGMQWAIDYVLSQLNNGYGFYALPVTGGGVMTFSQWNRPYTYANTLGGVFIASASGAASYDLAMTNGYGSSDGNSEIRMDSHGEDFSITNGFYEFAGRGGNTGVGAASPPSGLGDGITITANNTGVVVSGNTISGNSVDGINDVGIGSAITGNFIHHNLYDGYSNGSGVPGTVTGNTFFSNLRYGVNTGIPAPCLSGNSSLSNSSGDVPAGKSGCSTALSGTTSTITGTSLSATCDSGTANVPGAQPGAKVEVSTTDGTDIGGAFNIRASVTSANTVTVYVCGTGTPASKAYNVGVTP